VICINALSNLRRPVTITLVSALLIAGLVAVTTSALAASFSTRVTISFDRAGAARDVFRGRVFAASENCRSHRRVAVFRKRRGPDRMIGSDRSEDNGRWSIDVEGHAARGRYYAKAARKDLGGGDFCDADRSRTIRVA